MPFPKSFRESSDRVDISLRGKLVQKGGALVRSAGNAKLYKGESLFLLSNSEKCGRAPAVTRFSSFYLEF